MSIVIRDGAFTADRWVADGGAFVALQDFEPATGGAAEARDRIGLDVPSSTDTQTLIPLLSAIGAIRIDFPSFADGRGFSIATALREAGFSGLLRARGHVICEQYPLALRCGFDEIEIDDALARRQGEAHWRAALPRAAGGYLERLRQPAGHSASAA